MADSTASTAASDTSTVTKPKPYNSEKGGVGYFTSPGDHPTRHDKEGNPVACNVFYVPLDAEHAQLCAKAGLMRMSDVINAEEYGLNRFIGLGSQAPEDAHESFIDIEAQFEAALENQRTALASVADTLKARTTRDKKIKALWRSACKDAKDLTELAELDDSFESELKAAERSVRKWEKRLGITGTNRSYFYVAPEGDNEESEDE